MNSFVQALDPALKACSWAQLLKHKNDENAVRLDKMINGIQGKLKGCCQSADFSFTCLVEYLTGRILPTSVRDEEITWQRYSLFQAFFTSTAVLFEQLGAAQNTILSDTLLQQRGSDQPGVRVALGSRLDRQIFNFSTRAYNSRKVAVRAIQAIRNHVAHVGPFLDSESILQPHPVSADRLPASQLSKSFLAAVGVQLYAGDVIKSPTEMLSELRISGDESLAIVAQILFEEAVRYIHDLARGIEVVGPGLVYV